MSRLSLATTVLAFAVVVMGAYVRLSDAGLGCPDWPGCYGRLAVPEHHEVQASHPGHTLDAPKAWKEMIHRYLAATLGLFILVLAFLSLKEKRPEIALRKLSWFLVLLVVFQALLGRYTVTLKLHPFVVMAHLIGGFTTFSLLGWATLRRLRVFESTDGNTDQASVKSAWIYSALVLLILQILLGGWMSANYASLACPDFPTCQGHLWPPMDFGQAFTLWRETGTNYEGGVLDNPSRIAIHWMHRMGAVVVFLGIGALGLRAFLRGKGPLRTVGALLLGLLTLQIALGISNVVLKLPLGMATAHNGTAALLLLTLLALRQALPERSST